MLDSTAAILAALIAATVTVAGWNVTSFLSRRREDRTRRLELTLKHIERQIEELYGPLLSLIVQIRSTWAVQMRLLSEVDQKDRVSTSKSFRIEFFLPLHAEMKGVLSSKLFLVEGGEVPSSFRRYLEHSAEQFLRDHLEEKLALDASVALQAMWPEQLEEEIEATLKELMSQYNECLSDLDPRSPYRVKEA